MKLLKKLLIGLVILAVVFVAVGFFLPTGFEVNRSIKVKSKKQAAFDLISDLKTWPTWTAWTKERYPDIEYSYGEVTQGKGASYSWTGDDPGWDGESGAGNGKMVITEADPDNGIKFELTFEGMGTSYGHITFDEIEGETKVNWKVTGDIDTPVIGGYFVLCMGSLMGPELEKGLEKAKAQIEEAQKEEPKP